MMRGSPLHVLLIDDQAFVAETISSMLKDQNDIVFHYCENPSVAIQHAETIKPTVILQDLVMPGVDGLMLVKYFRANPMTKDVPMIVLSSKEEPLVKAEAFALGANDYLVKLPDKIELIARIRHHAESYVRLLERNLAYEKLAESQKILKQELKEAADYVRSLLPSPQEKPICTAWRFIPSLMLGGDALGYHWLDEDHFAFFLLDVCGHGVGAALLSISIENVLKSKTLPDTDFLDPESVLRSLNQAFQMEHHNNMFFTIWYGVYNQKTRELVFANGGHPPAVLLRKKQDGSLEEKLFTSTSIIIGGVRDIEIEKKSFLIEPGDQIYLFSDGIFELTKQDKSMMQYSEFIPVLKAFSREGKSGLDAIIEEMQKIQGTSTFHDDVSLLYLEFS